MKQILNALFFSFSYFSIIPIFVKNLEVKEDTYKYTLFFLPFVGFVLALIVLGVNLLLGNFFNAIYASLVSAVLYLFLYGFLHTEAIIDVVDAWFASFSGKDAHKIMKEPTIGAIGALYACCFIILKIAIITYILHEKQYFLFIIVLVFSRLNLIYLLQYFGFNKDSFLSLAFKSAGVLKLKMFALIYFFIPLMFSLKVFVLFSLSLLCFYIILKILSNKFNFVNGDCLGFTLEHTELILLNIGLVLFL